MRRIFKCPPSIRATVPIRVPSLSTTSRVTLTGFVPSYSDKYEAERVAKRVRGVTAVANDLEVKLATGSERPDPDIARDAVDKLKQELPYSSQNIKVTVRQAWITLEGEVDWDFQRRSAEAAVRNVKGAKGVINLIRIKESVSASDGRRRSSKR